MLQDKNDQAHTGLSLREVRINKSLLKLISFWDRQKESVISSLALRFQVFFFFDGLLRLQPTKIRQSKFFNTRILLIYWVIKVESD